MRYEDVSQATPEATTLARADVDSLPPGATGPATGNAISGTGTITGVAGADSIGDAPGQIVAVQGAGGASTGANGEFVVKGAYGVLTIESDGSYTYVRNAAAPDGVDDVFTYTLADHNGQRSSTTLTIELGFEPPSEAATAALQGVPGVITLPAGVEVSDIHVVGRDLVIDLPDGTHMTIPGGAVFVPQLVIGDVELPPSNLAALLIDSEPQPAAGPPASSGGNFAVDVPPLDPGVPLGDLIPPTELVFQPPEFRDINQFEDREPTVVIETPDNPAGAVNATESVFERGLAVRGGEPAGSGEIADGNGSNNSDTSEANSGTIVYTAEDGLESITVNGVAITGVGQVIDGQFGTITITSIADGAIGYSYTLLDNTSGDNTADNFTVVVTDVDGDTATGTLAVHIVDDIPTAHNDADSLTVADTGTDGNVMTGAGTSSGSSGADVVGADDATVTGAHGGTSGGFTLVPQDGSGVIIHGTFGDLELHDDGSYTYTRTAAHAGGNDVFTYQLTDGDGDSSTATLTISVPQINQAPEVRSADVSVSEEGLVGGNQDSTGSPDTTNLAANSGTIFINDPDGDATTATLGVPSGSFTSGGVPVVWAVSDDGHTLTGTAGGDTVVTVTIDDSGHFNVSLTGPFDDPGANVEDSISFDVPVQVSDGIATVSTSIGVSVEDDSPTVTNVTAGAGVVLDETDAGSLAGYPISETSASAVVTATTSSGADTPASTVYGLSITGGSGTSSGLATAVGDHAITLVQIDADTVEGQYQDGGTQTAFTIQMNADGTLTVTQDVPLEHLVDGSSAAAYNDALDLTGLVNATVTVTDADGDTASGSAAIGGNIVFLDDGPSIDVAAGSDANIVLETQDAQTAGGASDTATSSANFGGVFSIASSSGGGDGAAAAPALAYALGAVDGTDSGLTQTGNTIYLYQLANGSVVGSTSATEGGVTGANTVFSVTVDGSGQVTLTQFSQIDHPIADDPSATDAPFADQTVSLADGAITLTASATITDNDGDTATDSQTVGIGSNIIFDDDGPSVTNVTAGAGVVLDETDAGSLAGYPISETSASAVVTATTSSGADTPASTVYGLSITGGSGTSSGLATAVGDHAITLVQIDADTVEGQYQDGGTQTAFTIQMNADGTLTVTQDVPLEHLVDGSSAAAYNDALDLTGLVNATVTVTDADGDTASGSAAIGGNIVFLDDGPSIDVAAGSDANIVLETQDAQTAGGASDTATSSANFGGVFSIASSSGGGDGAAAAPALAYALGAVDGTDSGLTQTGNTIYLYQLANGSVVGSTSATEGGVTGANTVFSVTVDGSGQVTLTQFSQIDHPIADDPSATDAPFADQTVSLADGAITLTASATITDNDGDTATDSQTVGIGSNIIFDDDGPSVTNVTAGAGVVLDETDAGSLAGYPISETSASAVVTATTSSGADTPASTVYGLSITGGSGTSSGLATAVGDHAITLVQIDADTVEGQYQDGGTQTAFTIQMNADGTLTVTQDVPLEHLVDGSSAAAYNDALDLTGLVNATVTVTDADGDTASGSAAIGGNIVFLDDGPSIDVAAGSDANIVLETQDAQTAGGASDTATSSANFGGVFSIASSSGGGDGAAAAPALAYALGAVDGTDSGLTQTGNTIYLYQLANGSVVGSTSATEGGVTGANTVFSVTVDGSGQVTLTQFSQIDHPIADDPSATDAPFADQTVSLADGAITLTASATITDNDGDTATDSQTVGIGSNIIFDDDGPSVTNVTAGAGVVLDETDAGSLAGYPISETSASAVVTATTSSGADTPASTVYGLSITGGSGTSSGLATAVGDHAITLVQIDADTVEGQYQDGGTQTAFTIQMNADGTLTVTQDVPLEHLVDGSSAAAYNDALDLTGLVNATVTVTDADGDTASGSAAIGGNIVFLDDGPSIDVAAGSDANIVLETQDAQTAGGASDTATSSANFGGVFSIASSSGGGDGAAAAPALAYALGAVDGTDSGLTQTGNTIYLYQLANGSVVGSTSATEGGVTGANTVFSVTVDGSGQVTLTQFSQIDHPIADDPSATDAPFADQTVSLADGAITLTASATITDNDGDTATDSQTVGIGSNIIFDDDGPSVTNVTGASSITLDETSVGDINGWPATAVTSAAAMISATVATGADTPATTTYGLALAGGVSTLDSGLQTAQGDHEITLVQIDADTIEGQYQDGGTQTAFTIQMNANGTVTYTQDVPLEHSDDGNTATAYNDTNTPITFDGLVLGTITVTDADGDTASGSTNIGDQISVFDDGPTAIAPDSIVTTDEPQGPLFASLDLGDNDVTDNFGADGPGTITFANIADGDPSGLTSGGEAITYWLSADGQTLEGRASSTDGTDGSLVFSVHIDQATSQYDFTQYETIDNGSGVTFSDLSGGVAGNPPFKLIIESGESTELLATPINGSSINSDTDDMGVDSQFIDTTASTDKGVRLDFGDFTYVNQGGNTSDDKFTMDSHANVNGFKFSIDQVSNGTTADIHLVAYDADEDGGVQESSPNTAGDVIDSITSVKVYDTTGTLVGTYTGDGSIAGTSATIDFITTDPNHVTVSIDNLPSGYSVQTYTADGYNAIAITNPGNDSSGDTDGKYSLSAFSIENTNTGQPINLSYDLQVTDSDGDFTTVAGAINIQLDPAAANTASTLSALSTLSTESLMTTSSNLLATNDNSSGDKGQGQQTYSNNALMFGAVAAAGLMSEQAAASDTSHGSTHQLSTADGSLVGGGTIEQVQLTAGDDSNVQSISGETKVAASDVQQPLDSSHQPDDSQSLSLDGGDHAPSGAPTALPQGTDMPVHSDAAAGQAVAAAAVAMPSAEQIAALASGSGNGVAGDQHAPVDGSAQHNEVVGKVLADSLAGGGGHESAIDAVLNNLPSHGGANAALEALASHGAANVPAWDAGGLASFAAAHPVFTMETMMLHPDAAPAAHS